MTRIARTIPLDKSALRGVAKRLEGQLVDSARVAVRSRPNEPIRWRQVWAKEVHRIKNVIGTNLLVEVLLVAGRDHGPGPYVSAGGAGTNRRTGDPVVIVKLNGSYSAEHYAEVAEAGFLWLQIYRMLLHEVSHAADISKPRYDAGPASGEYDVEDLPLYYNDPVEVRAYMQEVVNEILSFGGKRENVKKVLKLFRKSREQGVEVLLKNSDTWHEIKPYLTFQNRKRVMKNVYQALVEEGLV